MIYPTPSPAEFEYPEVELNNSELGLLEWVLKSNRDSWQNARDDPNQDFREDNVHDTVYVLNGLISRVTELQRSGGDGGTLSINTPREMDEILYGTLLCLQNISDGTVGLRGYDSDAVMASYESLLSRFTDAHWEDNPLAEYWYEFDDLTPASPYCLRWLANSGTVLPQCSDLVLLILSRVIGTNPLSLVAVDRKSVV